MPHLGDFQRILTQFKRFKEPRTCIITLYFYHRYHIVYIPPFLKIPKRLIPAYSELLNSQPNRRLNAAKFITHCRQPNGFMSNHFVDTLLFLEEIQVRIVNLIEYYVPFCRIFLCLFFTDQRSKREIQVLSRSHRKIGRFSRPIGSV